MSRNLQENQLWGKVGSVVSNTDFLKSVRGFAGEHLKEPGKETREISGKTKTTTQVKLNNGHLCFKMDGFPFLDFY